MVITTALSHDFLSVHDQLVYKSQCLSSKSFEQCTSKAIGTSHVSKCNVGHDYNVTWGRGACTHVLVVRYRCMNMTWTSSSNSE